MKKLIIYIFLLVASPTSILAQTTVGTGGIYSTLSDAFTAINEGNLTGDITLEIISSITESFPAVLHENGYNATADYTSVRIYPTGSGYIIDGDFDGPLIEFSGASNVTFDGRVNQSGLADLTIANINTGTSASTISFTESANTNLINYCIIKGSGTGALTSGVVLFSTASIDPLIVIGNNGNAIDRNYITGNGVNRPLNAILSSGSSGKENSGNIISDNNIYDFLNKGLNSNGILLSLFSTTWTIQGNSFYETSSFTSTASVTYNCIKIDNVSGTGFSVSGNFIGGKSASCGGTAWTKSSLNTIFYGIYINAGATVSSTIQNNTIKNLSWSNSGAASWTGIHIAAGNVNIGTVIGNIIGDASSTGSVNVTGASNNTNFYGINLASGGTIDCQNNIIGSITTANGSINSSNFTGINKTGAGTTTINNNTIGSLTQANSIFASSTSTSSAQNVFGISNAGTGNVIIDGNTIANLTNGTTNATAGTAGLINGIKSTDGTDIISNNIIRDLTIANANTSATNTASVCGITLTGATLKTITGNTIYNLKNTFNSFAGSVIGLYFTGNTGANVVSENFIHSLSVTGVSSTSASTYGIQIAAGATTYSNNIVSLGGNTQMTIYGLYETGAAGNNNNLYFNSVYINGVPTSGAGNSYALYSAVTTNTRNFRNNIFMNARSNSGATGTHYGAYFNYSSDAALTCNYNDYNVSGTGGVLGNYGGDKAALPVVTTQDLNSLANDPAFVNGGGTTAEDYLPTVALGAVSGTGILTDFNGATRSGTPTMGAFEAGSCLNPTNGGIIAAVQIGCVPFDPVSFTSTTPASGYTGTFLEYKWQESITSSGAGFSDIASSNSATYNAGVINQTTWYKRLARVSCIGAGDWTGAAESNVLMVTVNPLPGIGLTVSSGGPVCTGTGTNITVALSEAGVNYQLRNGVTHVGTSVAGNGGNINLPTGNLASATTFNVLATNAITSCSAQLTQTATVNINPLPNAGLSVNGTGSICNGTSTNITVALSEIGIDYQLRNDNANELVGSPVAGTGGTINLPTGSMTYNIQYNILATNTTTSCFAQLTEKEVVSIDPPSVGGSISGTSPVTYGSSTGTMTLTGYTGIIQRWEKHFNAGTWSAISNTNATYSETASSAGIWGYRAVVKSGSCAETNSTEFSITVNKAALTITADNKSKNYGASLPVLTVTYSGFVNGDVAPVTPPAISTTATAASPVGTYPVTASGAADPNYNISYIAGTLSVDKVPLTITADNKSKNYGASLPVLTVTYSGLVNGDIAPVTPPAISTTATVASPVGTYPVTASGAADPNYNISYVAGTLTVDKVPLTITADNKSKNYGASLPVLTVTYSGLVNGDVAPATPPGVSTTATAASPVGTYPVTASGAADPNYNISYVAGTLSVDKVPLTITADNKNKNYGASLPVLTVTYSGLVNGDVAAATPPAISTTATAASPVGTYPVTASGAADPNYNISYVAGTLSVDKVSLTVTADNKSKNYGDANPPLTITFTGFVGTDDQTVLDVLPSVTTTALQNSNAGTYQIIASGGSDNNYAFTYIDGVLTINKADQTITFNVLVNKSYGDGDFAASASASSGLSVSFSSGNISVATVAGNSVHIVTTGTVVITASQSGNGNYNAAPDAPQTLSVGKAGLSFTADNKTKEYKALNPVLTYTVSGFVNGETQSVLDVLPSIQTTAVQNSPKGDYPITITGGSDNNYTYIYIPGVLTITKFQQTITFTGFPVRLLVKDVYTLVATSTSGFPVLFESMDASVASVSGDRLTGVSKGTVQIRAYHQGDLNYDPAEAVVTVEVYSTHKDIMHLFTPNNDGFNDQWELPDLAAWGKCDVKVYNRWGKLVFSDANYNNLWDGTSNGAPLPEGPYYFIIKTQNAGVVKGTVNIVR